MAANAARQILEEYPVRGHHDAQAFEAALASAHDFADCLAALSAQARSRGFDAVLCRHAIDEAGQRVAHERHTLDESAAALFDQPAFRLAWPVEAQALARSLPLTWTVDDWPGGHGLAARTAMECLAGAGIEGGAALAVRGPAGRVTLVLLFRSGGPVAANELDRWLLAVPRLHARLCDLLAGKGRAPELSRRELEILRLAAEGLTAAAAAAALNVTEATIKFHLAGVRKKLGVRKTAEAIARVYAL